MEGSDATAGGGHLREGLPLSYRRICKPCFWQNPCAAEPRMKLEATCDPCWGARLWFLPVGEAGLSV